MLKAATGVEPEIVGKPYPGMYELAMHRLGVQTAETLMVGDAYETDIAPGSQAGPCPPPVS
ncbi:MAG: HAD-IA family hydrolase [Caldilineaceae bacterium]